MKKRQLKKRISEAYRSEAPDLRSKILASCEKEEQLPRKTLEAEAAHRPARSVTYTPVFRRVAAAMICLMLFVSGLSVGMLIPEESGEPVSAVAENFVYLDVNPSIELQMDAENKIVKCIASNEDAKKILTGLSLEGVEMNTALTAIVGSMYVNGYLTEDSNSILVSVDGKDEATTDTLLSTITEKINQAFENSELDCSIIAQGVDVNDELRKRAEENGVSVGKMRFVDKLVDGLEDYEPEDASALADMSIGDLNLIYDTRPGKGDKNDPFDKDITSGHVSGVAEKYQAIMEMLASLDIDPSEVEDYEIKAGASFEGGRPKIVYTLLIRFKNDDTVHSFEVDFESVSIVKKDEKNSDDRSQNNQDDSDQESGKLPNGSAAGRP